MCGIIGIFNTQGAPVSAPVIERMTKRLQHRGPDAQNTFYNNCIGLGHTRLSVIDLSSSANQPMATQNNDFVITYNGELYNFKELKQDLQSRGHAFITQSDTEVVLKSYQEWGPHCVEKFNGMFAFGIWDDTNQTLFLARDRYGIKPLYTTWINDELAFASEFKAFTEHPHFKPALNKDALYEYLTFQNIFSTNTLYNNVSLFPAGCWALVKSDDQKITHHRYWDYCFEEPETQKSFDEYQDELKSLFEQAVKRQLFSDVEVGSYLSGGIDSASIASQAARISPSLQTFTCGFDLSTASTAELAFDERDRARQISKHIGSKHHDFMLGAGDLEHCLPDLTYHLEDLRVGQSYPNYYAAKLVSQHVKVVLSGTGGDELFGGYPWRYYRAVINDDFDHYISKYYSFWQRMLSDEELSAVTRPFFSDVQNSDTRSLFKSVFVSKQNQLDRPEDYINQSLYFEAKTFLHGLLLVEDKISMNHSLETRLPFLDNDLVDFAIRLPVKYKLGNLQNIVRLNENEPGPKTRRYFEKTKDGKILLRKVLSKYVPDFVSNAEKQGFSAPDASWFRDESTAFIQKRLFDPNAKIYEYLDRNHVQSIVNDHINGNTNRRLFIWSLLNLEQWFETFL